MRIGATIKLLAALLVLCATSSAQDGSHIQYDTADAESAFLRIVYDAAREPVVLQTAIASYESMDKENSGRRIDLVGALHIADESYFSELNRRFTDYDSVLYELVAPPGTRVPNGGPEEPGMLANTQLAIKNALGLAFQLEEIDYQAGNFVHADMSPEQISASMAARNENLYQFFWKIFFFATKQYAKDPLGNKQADLWAALVAPDQERALKIELAKELVNFDDVTRSLEGPEGSTLIAGRNEKALEVLRARMAAGDREIAVFYGVGHLSHLEDRLIDDFGLRRSGTDWLSAWDLGPTETN